MITTGSPIDETTKTSEILAFTDDLREDVECEKYPFYPIGVWVATGGMIGNVPLICGGLDGSKTRTDECYSISPKEGAKRATRLIKAKTNGKGSIAVNDKELFVAGGYSDDEIEDSTEFVTLDQEPKLGPKLPYTVHRHCFVKIDESTAFLISGRSMSFNGGAKILIKNTLFYDIANKDFKNGPELFSARQWHACASLKVDGKTFVMVAGGTGRKDSEIWSQETNEWTKGPDAPMKLDHFAWPFTSSDGKEAFVYVAGSNGGSLLKFNQRIKDEWRWTVIERQLQMVSRNHYVLIEIPKELVSCKVVVD